MTAVNHEKGRAPFRIRTPKETILDSIELLPEVDLWRPIIEQADDGGYLSRDQAEMVLVQLGYTPAQFVDWLRQCPFSVFWNQQGGPDHPEASAAIRDVAELHEFWVAQQP
jgi:hypothetical protein